MENQPSRDIKFADRHQEIISRLEQIDGPEKKYQDLAEKMVQKSSSNMLKLLEVDSMNDITIKLEDGEIKACKGILMTQSEYFETMLGTENFKEGKSKVIEMKTFKKAPMEKVIRFIYSGKVEFDGLDNKEVFILMGMFRFFLLKEAESYLEAIFEVALVWSSFFSLCPSFYCFVVECFPIVVDLKLESMTRMFLEYFEEYSMFVGEIEGSWDEEYFHSSLKAMPFETFKMIAAQEFYEEEEDEDEEPSFYKDTLVKLYIELHEDSLDEDQKKEILAL